MSTDENNQGAGDQTQNGAGETTEEIKLSKKEYEELLGDRANYGSLKREFKDLKKSLETKETPEKTKSDDSELVYKTYLRAANIKDSDEVELALSTAKKWGMELDKLVDDPDFQAKLERLRTTKSNELATSNIRGGQGTNQAKNTEAYYVARGTPPTPQDVPDRKTRAKIIRGMMAKASTNGKTFYNS